MAGDMLPYFRIYAAETLSDERFAGWTMEERGAWFTLICINWREGSIPSDPDAIRRLLHVSPAAMRSLWSAISDRFVPHPDDPKRLASPRLEMEREEAQATIAKKSTAGKKGAVSRWKKKQPQCDSDGNVIADACDSDATVMRIDGPQLTAAQHSTDQPQAGDGIREPEAQEAAGSEPDQTLDAFVRQLMQSTCTTSPDYFRPGKDNRVAAELAEEIRSRGGPEAAAELCSDAMREEKRKTGNWPQHHRWYLTTLRGKPRAPFIEIPRHQLVGTPEWEEANKRREAMSQ